MKMLAIIQARMDSTRLPKKVLMKIAGKTVLEHVIRRVQKSRLIDKTVVATTINKADLKIAVLCKGLKICVFCGSENDVLDRYYQAAKKYRADNIVRITADCPLIDSAIVDRVVQKHLKTQADYTTNTLMESFPDGEDVEVIKFNALEKAWKNAKWFSEREHVTSYIRKHPEVFKLKNVKSEKNFSNKRWTLDNPEDLEFVKNVYKNLYKNDRCFNMRKILKLLEKHSELESINSHIKRNEGYTKSLKEDKIVK